MTRGLTEQERLVRLFHEHFGVAIKLRENQGLKGVVYAIEDTLLEINAKFVDMCKSQVSYSEARVQLLANALRYYANPKLNEAVKVGLNSPASDALAEAGLDKEPA